MFVYLLGLIRIVIIEIVATLSMICLEEQTRVYKYNFTPHVCAWLLKLPSSLVTGYPLNPRIF